MARRKPERKEERMGTTIACGALLATCIWAELSIARSLGADAGGERGES